MEQAAERVGLAHARLRTKSGALVLAVIATFLPPSPNDKYGRGSALAKPHALIRSDVARASESCLLSRALPRARALKIAK